jgi:ligand-binding sensor domain-containing protein/signal transduction histidine kinase
LDARRRDKSKVLLWLSLKANVNRFCEMIPPPRRATAKLTNMPRRSWILAAVWCLLFVSLVSTRVAAGVPYDVTVWPPPTETDTDTENRLPENTIISLIQTRDGYLWLGTFSGYLVRFDGVHFTSFDEENTPGLDSSAIVVLFEDSQRNLWVGTQSGAILLIKNGVVTPLPIGSHSHEGRLVSICEDSLGAIWLCMADGQLYRRFDDKFENWQLPERESRYRAIIAEKSGSLWLGTDNNLYEMDPKADFSTPRLPIAQTLAMTNHLDFLYASPHGGYWRLVGGEVQKVTTNGVDTVWKTYPWNRSETPVSCACEDPLGNFIVGTIGKGVWVFDASGTSAPAHISSEQGLSHDSILCMCVDREGSLWVGTDSGGLDRVKKQIFGVISSGNSVQSVCEDAQGGIWFGGVLSRLKNGQIHQIGLQQGLTNLFIRTVFVDHNQNVWAGADNVGILGVRQDIFLRPPGYELINDHISAIYEDHGQRLWFGTQNGLALWTGSGWKVFTTSDHLSSDSIRAIADDASGNLWIGTDGGGLDRLRDGQVNVWHKKDGLPSEHISALYADEQGVLWIGTASGLARLHDGKFAKYTTREGLAANSIAYITEDDRDCLWLGSNSGLMRISKKALNDFADGLTNFVSCHTYGTSDGLPIRECAQGSQPAAWRGHDGELWFATKRGLVHVNPAEIRLNTNQPPVAIESVLVDGHEQFTNGIRAALPASITIPAPREHFEIRFTSLNLSAPYKARFKYRMEGHETAWTETKGDERSATYRKLPPGHYIFQVIACNEDDVWNDAGATLAFIVEPPFWRTWWFESLSAIIVLAGIIGIVHYLSTQRLQRQLEGLRQQQALEKDRARIARDIHDQLGASMTQVSLLGEMVESDKNDPAEVEAHARQITQTARDTSRVLDEIVWTVNPSNDTLEGLVNYICKYAQEYLAVADIRYRLDVPPQLPDRQISPEVRHNVFLAAKEAVTNVVRHAKATEVWLRLRLEPSRFVLEIQDNGRGPVGLEGKQSRNGLRNMHKRMEDIGGSFALTSGPEGGALARLTVPLNHQ